jgi:hypothetical protein
MVNALPLLVDRLAFVQGRHVPTPDELDTLLSDISACGYASEAREVVEAWTRKWRDVESAFTTKWNRPMTHSLRIATVVVEYNGTRGTFSADDQGVYFTEFLGVTVDGTPEYGATQLVARPTYLGPDRRDPATYRRSSDGPGWMNNASSVRPGDRRRRW